MAEFLTELHLSLKPGSDSVYILDEPLVYFSDIIGKVEVPTGFNTDLASVPRVPIVYSMWGGKAHREGVLHDYIFRKDSDPCVPFMLANWVFLEAMKSRGKPFYIRHPMYAGVVAGGYWSYHKRLVGDEL